MEALYEGRVGKQRGENANASRAFAGARGGFGFGNITEGVNRSQDFGARLDIDFVRRVYDARNSGDAHARFVGDVIDC